MQCEYNILSHTIWTRVALEYASKYTQREHTTYSHARTHATYSSMNAWITRTRKFATLQFNTSHNIGNWAACRCRQCNYHIRIVSLRVWSGPNGCFSVHENEMKRRRRMSRVAYMLRPATIHIYPNTAKTQIFLLLKNRSFRIILWWLFRLIRIIPQP